MSDIVERLRTAANNNRIQAERGTTTTGEILTALGCQTKEAVASMHDEAADEITRLRSLLKEAAMALAAVMEDDNVPYDESCANHEWGRSVLSKIKGDAR